MVSDFKSYKIENIAEEMGDAPFGSNLKSVDYTDSGALVVQGKNIQGLAFDWSSKRHVSIDKWKSLPRSQCYVGDLIFPKVGTIGKVGILTACDGYDKYLLSTNTMRLRVNQKVANQRYVYYYFSWNKTANLINSMSSTSVQPVFNFTTLKNFEISLPPLPEQKAIAHILGTLDDKIELNRQMNETLEAMAQVLFKSWFVDFDPVIDNALLAGKAIPEPLKERAELRQAQLDSGKAKANSKINDLFPSEFEFTEELGWIPKGWSVLKFREITEAKQGKYLPSKEMQDQQDENYHFPVWGGNGIRGYSEEYIYEEPVVVMTCRGSNCGLLKITDGKSWITNTSFACKPKVGSTFFLYQYFSHDDFSSCISGSAQPQITYTALENKIMPFPISEKTVQRASEWLQILRNRQLSTLKQNETLAKLRDTLLPKLISGELRIADAEKLAENI